LLYALLDTGDLILRELTLFAAVGFLFLGLSDLGVDLLYLGLRLKRFAAGGGPLCAATPPAAKQPGPIAVFIPAWDESAVIAAMLGHAQRAFGEADCRLYVGCYPNDPATIAAVRSAAGPKVRLVVTPTPGPTTKAECLNALWSRMRADERAERLRFKAVVLHDAEDVVHADELALFDALIEQFDLVQLPVLPLVDQRSRWIAGHYIDEFAEAHGKEMVVREALGASIPSAGVGCAISRRALDALSRRHGLPFDPGSLTEDYELGVRLRAAGYPAAFVRLPGGAGGAVVATREYFPGTIHAAVTQKSRWMTGIALAGWDRLGWEGGFAEFWMRLRDRQSVFAALLLFVGYLALVLCPVLMLAGWSAGRPAEPFSGPVLALLAVNSLLLLWRLGMRFAFVAAAYGWREGLRALPRIVTGNIVAMMAARRAAGRYLTMLRTGRPAAWDKTAHAFPGQRQPE
jgi:adsorption protein B